MLNRIKLLLGITSNEKDEIIEGLIDLSENEIREYCDIEDVGKFSSVIIQMVIYKYNRLGTEGLSSESYNNASYTYSDYPESIQKILKKNRRVKVF